MKKKEEEDFEQILFKKYPSLFETNEDGELLPQFQRCWNDCPKGWEQLVDDLFFTINDYVCNTSRAVNDPSKKHIDFLIGICRKIDQRLGRIGFNVRNKKLYNRLFSFLRSKAQYIKQTPPPVKIAQYKEKFGTLRIYIDGGDDTVKGMIEFAEHLSSVTCQKTGKRGSLRNLRNWCVVLCDKEYKKIQNKTK
jgi:hypothetical protein